MIQHTTPNPIGQDVMLYVAGAERAIHCTCCDANVFTKRDVNRYQCRRCDTTYTATPDPHAPPPAAMEVPNA